MLPVITSARKTSVSQVMCFVTFLLVLSSHFESYLPGAIFRYVFPSPDVVKKRSVLTGSDDRADKSYIIY